MQTKKALQRTILYTMVAVMVLGPVLEALAARGRGGGGRASVSRSATRSTRSVSGGGVRQTTTKYHSRSSAGTSRARTSGGAYRGDDSGVIVGERGGVAWNEGRGVAVGESGGAAWNEDRGVAVGESGGAAWGNERGVVIGEEGGGGWTSEGGAIVGDERGAVWGEDRGVVVGENAGIAHGERGTVVVREGGGAYRGENVFIIGESNWAECEPFENNEEYWKFVAGATAVLAIGAMFTAPPTNYTVVEVSTTPYYYHEHVFYEKVYHNGEYVYTVVRPPIGARVAVLPPGVAVLNVGGVEYYHWQDQDCYYVKDGSDYLVVTAP
jgi:hypothetical protein